MKYNANHRINRQEQRHGSTAVRPGIAMPRRSFRLEGAFVRNDRGRCHPSLIDEFSMRSGAIEKNRI
ncbi:hypothetical protein AiwAL_08435 [Acidiphilium sp. AL]|uniref:Uncharacterized protein n=1 Tax=Acidiphilium iwatense TaxID=768198 RepID=A0ABS9DUN9_9PROT|nr:MULTISPECIES: hypothetical protein [Acidiphilium]MCF3945192.1 hypothetical protein [Acidiphilium iwatense]MCU4160135.1 hypothetical protein [Acidiphilium sp. AL]